MSRKPLHRVSNLGEGGFEMYKLNSLRSLVRLEGGGS